MNTIKISTKKAAVLNLNIDGKDVLIPYSAANIDGYRNVSAVMAKYSRLTNESMRLDPANMSQEDALKALDLSIDLIDELRSGVRTAIGRDAYAEYLEAVENDIPLPAWVAMLVAIVAGYNEYFHDVTSTEGKRE